MKPNPSHPLRKQYHKEIDLAILELIQLKYKGFYSIPKISWWLLKYENLNEYSFSYRHTDSCIKNMSCSCAWDSPETRFNSIYCKLEETADLYIHEAYFRNEIEIYNTIQGNQDLINKWLLKNEKLGAEAFIEFWIEWFEEDMNLVEPFLGKKEELEIKFKADEWKSTIQFLKIFNDLYWTSDIIN